MAPKKAQPKEAKDKQTRRLWTAREEDLLLTCMLNVFGEQWKAESGFKPGFFVRVEKELKKHLPGTDLKANPNIESKVKLWKEKYGAICDLLQVSGFSWDHSRQCVIVDDENVWNEYEKMHPKAKRMNGKPFPMFEGWQTLFGKDRATGEMAEDPEDIPDDTFVETPSTNPSTIPDVNDDLWDDCYVPRFANGENLFPNDTFVAGDSSGAPTTPRARANPTTPISNVGTNPPPKKKAKFDVVREMMQGCMDQNNTFMERMIDVIGFDEKLSKKRSTVFPELMKLDLDEFDRFKVNNIILKSEERVDAFFAIPDDMKQRWVEGVLDGKVTFD